jgi:HK97 family phage portal protein
MAQRIRNGFAQITNANILQETASINDESFLEWLGIKRNNDDKKPTSDVTYFTCLKMMSETVAKMPWKAYKKTKQGVQEIEDSDEITRLLKERPNPYTTPTAFWNAVEMNRNHYGNAYVYIQREFKRKKYGGEYKTTALWVMESDRVTILVDDKGYFGNKGKIWYAYGDKYSGEQYVFAHEDVMHFKTSHSLDGITGLPVQTILKNTVEGVLESQRFLNSLYKNGLTAKATLEYTGELNEEAVEKLRRVFERYGNGSQNTGKMLPVPLGMKLTPLDVKLTDAQFIELKKYSALQIAAAFGIKPNQINDYEKSSYSNSEMQQLSFYVDTTLFVLKQYEEEVNYKLLSPKQKEEGRYYKLNEKALLRTDSKTQMDILATAIKNGIETINEARKKLDLAYKEGGDELIVNGTYLPITEVGAAYNTQSKKEGE